MTKTIVLLRHGKEPGPKPASAGRSRLRIHASRRALAARLPQNLALWPRVQRTEIWVSPIVLPYITASIFSKALARAQGSAPEPQKMSFLGNGDIAAFLRAVAQSDADCIVCVEENPFVEETCALLTGARLSFLPGAMAAVSAPDTALDALRGAAGQPGEADGTAAGDGEAAAGAEGAACAGAGAENAAEGAEPAAAGCTLLWFTQGPDPKPWQTLVEAEDVLEKSFGKVEDRLATFLNDPNDPETLHKLRVSIRTLRSLLLFLAPFGKKEKLRQAQRDLRRLVLPTSRLRELDVLADEALRMDPPASELACACGRLREQERDRVLAVLSSDKARQALDRVETACRRFPWKRRIEENGLGRQKIARRFDQALLQVEKHLATCDLADAEATHRLRKEAKRVRYAAEGFAAFIGDDPSREASRAMKAVQDDLGALCDARVNASIVADFPRKGLSEQALRDLAAMEARSRYLIARRLRDSATCGQAAPSPDQG